MSNASKKVVPLPFEIPPGVTHWSLAPMSGGEQLGRAVDGVEHFEWPIADLTISVVREWFGAGRFFCSLLGKSKKPGSKGQRATLAKKKLVLSAERAAEVEAVTVPAPASFQNDRPAAVPVFQPGDPWAAALSLFQVINQSAETSARRAIESDRSFMAQTIAVVMGGREVRAQADASNAAIASALTSIAERLDRLEAADEGDEEEEEEEGEEEEAEPPARTPREALERTGARMVTEMLPGVVAGVGGTVNRVVEHFTKEKAASVAVEGVKS